MTDYNGASVTYGPTTITPLFTKACEIETKTVTVKSGQVLKKWTWLETDTTGLVVAHSGINEKALVTFPAKVDTGETVIIAGLTFTAGSNATTTQAELVAAWKDLTVGMTAAQANAAKPTACTAAIGTFTAGTLTGYNSKSSATAGSVLFVSTTPNAGVTDLAVTGTGDASSVTVTAISSPQTKIAGLLVFDVDASGGNVDASAYVSGNVWADAVVWKNNIGIDTITLADLTTKAVTEYDSGCYGTSAAAILLQKKFVESSEFELSYRKAGEIY